MWLQMDEETRVVFSRAMPRLEAEEAQQQIRLLLAGTGHMEKKEFAEYMRELDMISFGRKRSRRLSIRPKSFEEFQRLAGDIAGFQVSMVT